jgi:hypothetical protein
MEIRPDPGRIVEIIGCFLPDRPTRPTPGSLSSIGLKWDDAVIERVSNHIASKFYRLACAEAC